MNKKLISIILLLIALSSIVMYYSTKHVKTPKKLKERIEVYRYNSKITSVKILNRGYF